MKQEQKSLMLDVKGCVEMPYVLSDMKQEGPETHSLPQRARWNSLWRVGLLNKPSQVLGHLLRSKLLVLVPHNFLAFFSACTSFYGAPCLQDGCGYGRAKSASYQGARLRTSTFPLPGILPLWGGWCSPENHSVPHHADVGKRCKLWQSDDNPLWRSTN